MESGSESGSESDSSSGSGSRSGSSSRSRSRSRPESKLTSTASSPISVPSSNSNLPRSDISQSGRPSPSDDIFSDSDEMSDVEESGSDADSVSKSNAHRRPRPTSNNKHSIARENEPILNEVNKLKLESYTYLAPYRKTLRPFVSDDVDESLRLAETSHESRADSEKLSEQPKILAAGCKMRWYQLEGLQWLRHNYDKGVNCVLADEMGLGKTLQVISFIAHLIFEAKQPGRHLVVVPLSVLFNWINELKRFCPAIAVLRLHSNETDEQQRLLHILNTPSICPPVVIVTYDSLKSTMKSGILKIVWRSVILDEGHRIKNDQSKLTKVVRQLRSRFKVVLTGTPVQNNLRETWTMLNFLMPHIFSTSEPFDGAFDLNAWKASTTDERSGRTFEGAGRPVDVTDPPDDFTSACEETDSGPSTAITKPSNEHIVRIDRNRLAALHYVLRIFTLRRLKAEVEQNLPAKVETLIYCPLTDLQRSCIEQLFMQDELAIRRLYAKQNSVTDDSSELVQQEANSEDTSQTIKSVTKLNSLVVQLRKAANHPYLFPGVEKPTATGEATEDIVSVSGKTVMLDKLLLKLKAKHHRVVLFSQFTKTLDILCDYLDFRHHKYCRLDGSTNRIMREVLINMFNKPESEFFIFCLSTRAGGEGINLTSADTVILFDSDWNPQVDLQAMARVHRIGQTKPVHIYRLVTAGSIEERIIQRAQKKLFLDGMVNRLSTTRAAELDAQTSDGIETLDGENLLSMIKFGWNNIFSAESGHDELTDEDLDMLIDRGRGSVGQPLSVATADYAELDRKAPCVQKLVENQQQTLHAFDESAPFVPVRNQSSKSAPRPQLSRVCGLDIDPSVDYSSLHRPKRQVKSRVITVMDEFCEEYTVLKSNDYTMEQGEPSLFLNSQKKIDLYAFTASRARQIAGRDYSNDDVCKVCGDGGDLILCDLCPVSCHLSCVGLKKAPHKMFSCPHHVCQECSRNSSSGGVLFRCDTCASAYCEDCLPTEADVIGSSKRFEALGFRMPGNAVYIICSPKCLNQHLTTESEDAADVGGETFRDDEGRDSSGGNGQDTKPKGANIVSLSRRSMDAMLSCALENAVVRLKVNCSASTNVCRFLSLSQVPNFPSRYLNSSHSVRGLLLACINACIASQQTPGPRDVSAANMDTFAAADRKIMDFGGTSTSASVDDTIVVFVSMTRVLAQAKKPLLFELSGLLGICGIEFLDDRDSLSDTVVKTALAGEKDIPEPLFR
jgi:SWI/SNF-related matrix-associated actin-dependent regulator of chromatin subfamily A member 5